MTTFWAILVQVVTQWIAYFIKDTKRKEEIERDVKAELEKYERETGTSADVREAAKDTKSRLLEKLRAKQK
jgi:hypothetical protein